MTDRTQSDVQPEICPPAGERRPRIALMGEFSAGKSTLANLMIGTTTLPAQVVATQLPPVWISHGDGPTKQVALDGQRTACDLDTESGFSLQKTAFIEFQCSADILKMCDLIDLPGLSDPNMHSEIWERIIPFADAVIWCSPATQAWRQSEAAVWEQVTDALKTKSILLLTRADMLVEEVDRRKVLDRAKRETEGLFRHVQLISLTQAALAETDDGLWEPSGADAFVNNFMAILNEIKVELDRLQGSQQPVDCPSAPEGEEDQVDALESRKTRERTQGSNMDATQASEYTPKFS